jgi:iron-sulfur cluster assembly accessory protein
MVRLTERAAEALRARAREEGLAACGLRLAVVGGGCSGLIYDLYLAERAAPEDHVFEAAMPVFVDRASHGFVDGTEIDFDGEGFRFSNPRARKVCRCGTSFEA